MRPISTSFEAINAIPFALESPHLCLSNGPLRDRNDPLVVKLQLLLLPSPPTEISPCRSLERLARFSRFLLLQKAIDYTFPTSVYTPRTAAPFLHYTSTFWRQFSVLLSFLYLLLKARILPFKLLIGPPGDAYHCSL